MAETAVLLNIGDMIDLAIGTPEDFTELFEDFVSRRGTDHTFLERVCQKGWLQLAVVGTVDFNMLQTVLHCLAQQMRVLGKNVELRGVLNNLPASRENTETIDIKEFAVDLSDEVPTKKDELPPRVPSSETLLVVERIKRPHSAGRDSSKPKSDTVRASKSAPRSKKKSSSLDSSYVTFSKFNLLEKAVEEIKARGPLEKAVHKLERAVEETKAQKHSDAPKQSKSTDSYSLLEEKIQQLEKAIEDMKSRRPSDPEAIVSRKTFNVLEKAVALLENAIDDLRAQRSAAALSQPNETPPSPTAITMLEKAVAMLEKSVDEIRAQRPSGPQSQPDNTQAFVTLSKFNILEKAVDEMRANRPIDPQSDTVTLSKLNALEKAVDEIRSQQPTNAESLPIPDDKLNVLQKSIEVLENAVNEIKNKQPDNQSDPQALPGDYKMLEKAVNVLEKAFEELKSDQMTAKQQPMVTLSKFNLLDKAVSVLEKSIGEMKGKPAGAQSQSDDGKGQTLSLVTLSKFNLLKETVDDIKDRVFTSIPKNESLLDAVRSQTNIKAIQDMWQSLNVQSRLETAEAGLGKLSSLVEDLISECTELQGAMQKRGDNKQELEPSSGSPRVTPTGASGSTSASGPRGPSSAGHRDPSPPMTWQRSPRPTNVEDLAAMRAHIEALQADVDSIMKNFCTLVEDMQNEAEAGQPGGESPTKSPSGTELSAQEKARRFSAMAKSLGDRVNTVEKRMVDCCATIGKVEGIVQDQLDSFQDQLEYLLKQVGGISTELSSGKLSPDLVKDLQGLMALFQTVQDMQVQLQKVHDTALQLATEKDDRQQYMNSLLEQIDLLKTVKLDREDMVEAMADKADLNMLSRKVSHDRFEAACDDLSKGLEQALGKLNLQEALWQQALDDIQREIETKLDKMELSPVKQFFNNKLQVLQDNLKQMASLRKEVEAAGTTKKLLREVNCISCDAKAVMQREVANPLPITKPLPANLSMKPYLSYELDTIRKSQQAQGQMPGTRNMHDWENIDKQMTAAKPPHKVRSETDKHLCNRYCGGSHTMTTPSQRVARLGHFIKQWGPDVLPLSSGMAAGDDGRMYRVTGEKVSAGPPPVGPPPEPANTPRPPKKHESKLGDSITSGRFPDCRCLENTEQRAKK